MSSQVPVIEADSEAIAPDHPSYKVGDTYYRVAAPSELGLRQVQALMKVSQRVQPAIDVLQGSEEGENVTEEAYEESIRSARHIIQMTSEIPEGTINDLSELEVMGYVSGFLRELTDTISASGRLLFR